jgi:hypothetical protein
MDIYFVIEANQIKVKTVVSQLVYKIVHKWKLQINFCYFFSRQCSAMIIIKYPWFTKKNMGNRYFEMIIITLIFILISPSVHLYRKIVSQTINSYLFILKFNLQKNLIYYIIIISKGKSKGYMKVNLIQLSIDSVFFVGP